MKVDLLPHNPHDILNAFILMSRNIFILSTIGLTTVSFSNKFNKYAKFVKIVALIILVYCILYGYKSTRDFNLYIQYLHQHKNKDPILEKQLQSWQGWVYLSYLYLIIISGICLILFFRKLKN